jgi:hypothetical protein
MRHSFARISIAAISVLLIAAKAPAPSLEGYWKGSRVLSATKVPTIVCSAGLRYTRAKRTLMLALRMSVYRGKADIGVRSSPRLTAGRDRLVHRWLIWGPVGPTDSATLGIRGEPS